MTSASHGIAVKGMLPGFNEVGRQSSGERSRQSNNINKAGGSTGNGNALIKHIRIQETGAVPKRSTNNSFSQKSENFRDDNSERHERLARKTNRKQFHDEDNREPRMAHRNIRSKDTLDESIDDPRFEYIKRVHCIQPLTGQRKINFPDENIECGLCRTFCRDYSTIKQHINNKNHLLKLEEHYSRRSAEEMPKLPAVISQKLCIVLEDMYHLHSIRSNNFEDRKNICAYINSIVFIKMQDCIVSLYGSSLHGLGLKDSEVNLLIKSQSDLEGAFDLVHSLIDSDKDKFGDVTVTRSASNKIIKMKFVDKNTGLSCEISPSTVVTAQVSNLILKYTEIDERACMIICLFRLWGKICRVDSPKYGTWPGFTLYLMAIHYLQQCDPPVLPVLQEELCEYFEEGKLEELDSSKVVKLLLGRWKKLNLSKLEELWSGMLKFYAYEFDERVVAINQIAVISRKDKGWFGNLHRYGVIDPLSPKRNLTKSVNNLKSLQYIQHCLKTAWKYFNIPQTLTGPVCGGILPDSFLPLQDYFKPYIACMDSTVKLIIANDKYLYSGETAEILRKEVYSHENFNLKVEQLKSSVGHMQKIPYPFDIVSENILILDKCKSMLLDKKHLYSKMFIIKKSAELLFRSVKSEILDYDFNSMNFTNGATLPLTCTRCRKEGHINVDCPCDKLPPLDPLPPIDNFTLDVLNRLCHKIYDTYRPTEAETQQKYAIVKNIENHLVRSCEVGVKLTLFGSSVNGFGFKRSDLDICLTFPKCNFGKEWLDKSNLIKKLYEHLHDYKEMKDLCPISTARVPILKFVHKSTQLEGDISLYNEVALVNSKLLLYYSKIDERAPILGFMLKKFAKVCDIGYASRGSLSSYGYTIMVIYFLQQCDPPVLPVLQELDDGTPATERRTIEGCDVYFFQDLDNLHKVWNGYRKNIKTAGQLWIEMLKFYTEEFDFVHNVISIRTSRLITKESKNFNTKNIAIEDPFNSSHNLGSALSMSMNIHILRQFQGARCHFGRLLPPPAPAENELEETFFDSYVPEGDPPNDRGCRICKVIGHLARDCSKNKLHHSRYKMKKGKSKKDENRERKINEENSCFRGSDNKPYKTDVTRKKNPHTKRNKPQACEESNEQTKMTGKELNKSQVQKSPPSSDTATLPERTHDQPGFQQNKSTVMKNGQFNPSSPQNVSVPQKFIPPLLNSVTPGQFCPPRYCGNAPPPPLIPQQFRFNNIPSQRLDNPRHYGGPGNSVILSGPPLMQYHFGSSVRPIGISPFSHARSSNYPQPFVAVNDRSVYNMGPASHSTMQISSGQQTVTNNVAQHPEKNSAVNGNVKQTNSNKKNRDLISK